MRSEIDALGDHRHQLHDDRGVDVGIQAHRDDAEARKRAAREEAEEPEQSLRVEELAECNLARSGNRHVGEEADQKQDGAGEEDLVPELGQANRIGQGLEYLHRRFIPRVPAVRCL